MVEDKTRLHCKKANPSYRCDRCTAFVCDIVADSLDTNIQSESLDLCTMIFVLSAIHPDKMVSVLLNIRKTLKPGGSILFRDYGLYDHAMLRFQKGRKLQENFYVRQDGTRAYYFSTEKLKHLFEKSGYETVSVCYVKKETMNKKEDICVPRVFVQGRFRKPQSSVNPQQ